MSTATAGGRAWATTQALLRAPCVPRPHTSEQAHAPLVTSSGEAASPAGAGADLTACTAWRATSSSSSSPDTANCGVGWVAGWRGTAAGGDACAADDEMGQ